jgi:hypothetical protein
MVTMLWCCSSSVLASSRGEEGEGEERESERVVSERDVRASKTAVISTLIGRVGVFVEEEKRVRVAAS